MGQQSSDLTCLSLWHQLQVTISWAARIRQSKLQECWLGADVFPELKSAHTLLCFRLFRSEGGRSIYSSTETDIKWHERDAIDRIAMDDDYPHRRVGRRRRVLSTWLLQVCTWRMVVW